MLVAEATPSVVFVTAAQTKTPHVKAEAQGEHHMDRKEGMQL